MSDWQRVQTLFLATVDMPPAERKQYLREACEGDTGLLDEVESLVELDSSDHTPLDEAIQREAASIFDAPVKAGSRVGSYSIVREVGRGGMGSVYLAVRADESFRKEVAIKIVKRGMDTADVLDRFRHERQILANLEHPYIARLFDGGSTADGVPYFVMEYIEGRPLDVHVREKKLGVEECCRLFLKILEAVGHAHRNLVVHRDLKPANILITADGTPKLLDFGVAKLLTGEAEGFQTRVEASRPYTPWYASPEQVWGRPITTSSDIYSLGVIFYEVLTGFRAQNIDEQTPMEIERIVCETEVPKPSAKNAAVGSDLDNIVRMAVRKEPERRYASAAQFAEDIRRHLDGEPIVATPASLRYSLGKFVLRNRVPVAMAMLLVTAMVVGMVVSLVQWRRARAAEHLAQAHLQEAQRQTALAEQEAAIARSATTEADHQRAVADSQRDEARKEQSLAETRLNELLGLADRTLITVNDRMAHMPGSIETRKQVVQATVDFLEKLELQGTLDWKLRQALALGYYKVAMVEGDPRGPSLGDRALAEKYLAKADSVLMPAYEQYPNSVGLRLRLLEIRSTMAEMWFSDGRRDEAIRMQESLLPVAHEAAKQHSDTLDSEKQEAALEGILSQELSTVDPAKALVHANRSIALHSALLETHPDSVNLLQELGVVLASTSGIYRSQGDLDNAATDLRRSIEIRERLKSEHPGDVQLQRSLVILYGTYASLLGGAAMPNLERPEEARAYAKKGVALARSMVESDPENATARMDLGMSLGKLGMISPAPDGARESLAALDESETLLTGVMGAHPKSAEAAVRLSTVMEFVARREEQMGRVADATSETRKALAVLDGVTAQHDRNVMLETAQLKQLLSLCEMAAGEREAALASVHDGLRVMEELYASTKPMSDAGNANMAEAWSWVAMMEDKASQPDQARKSAETAMGYWNAVTKPAFFAAHREAYAGVRMLVDAKTASAR